MGRSITHRGRSARHDPGVKRRIGAAVVVAVVMLASVGGWLAAVRSGDAGVSGPVASGARGVSGARGESRETGGAPPWAPPAVPTRLPMVRKLLAVGDSVMLGAARAIAAIPGWEATVDARGCRQPTWRGDGCGAVDIPSGVDALRAARAAGHLGGAVVLHLGNNGPMSAEQFDAVMAEVADQRLVLALTLREPRSYEAGNNAVIGGAVARWPNLRIVDWHAAARDRPEWFGDGEGIHLSSAGARAMADLIAAHLPAH